MTNRFTTAVALIALFAIIALAGRQNQANTATDVHVTNTATSTDAVPVKQVGGWSVTNTPNVHAFITNAPSAPVPTVGYDDKTAIKVKLDLLAADTAESASTSYQPPTGKRLIIDFVSVDSS